MNKRRKSRFQAWKYPSLILALGGTLLWDQLRSLKKKLSLSTEPHVLTRAAQQPEYIYVEDPRENDFSKLETKLFNNEFYKVGQFYLWCSGKVRSSQIYEYLFSFRQQMAWRFLRLAQDDNYYDRQKAVFSLARLPGLSDATCRQIAQACDMRTAVGLARIEGTDLRLLPDHPFKILDVDQVVYRIHKLLLRLNEDVQHPCLQYAITDIFAEQDDVGFSEQVQVIRRPNEIISKCTNALLHHSWLGNTTQSLVNHEGVELLVAMYRIIENDPSMSESVSDISRIISNLSMVPELRVHLFQTGCIKLLAQFLRNENLKVSLPASRALQNCDTDSVPHSKLEDAPQFRRNIYTLHPMFRRRSSDHVADVVFVHGLLGSVFITWRQRDPGSLMKSRGDRHFSLGRYDGKIAQLDITDMPTDTTVQHLPTVFRHFRKIIPRETDVQRTQCWPRDWLSRDCHKLRILGVNYDTNISNWAPMCPAISNRLTLADRSEHLIEVLLKAGVGSRPVIWVTHSMGGLIVKNLLVDCAKSDNPLRKRLSSNTKGVVFMSTPHRGSNMATLNPASRIILWPTIEVQELRQYAAPLLKLHEEFLGLVEKNPMKVLSFAERVPTFVKRLKMEVRMVENSSSLTGIGELYGLPLDHLTICKPATRESFVYRKILHFIEQIIRESQGVDANQDKQN